MTPDAPRQDWLVAWDDHFTDRVRSCTSCGTSLASWCYTGLYELGAQGVAYRLCRRCFTGDPGQRTLGALLHARYGTPDAPGKDRHAPCTR